MNPILPILYGIWLLVNICMLVRFARISERPKWWILFVSELAAIITALVVMFHYDRLPGGMFGGLTYMGEVLSSMGAVVLEAILLILSLVTMCLCISNHE